MPASSRYTLALPSGVRNSMVCLRLKSTSSFFSKGLQWAIMLPVALFHPNGTRTIAERLRSPQQIFVGASWCGTKRK